MTQIESNPASSAVRTIRASVGPIAAAPAGPGERGDLQAELHRRLRGCRASLPRADGRSVDDDSAEQVGLAGDERVADRRLAAGSAARRGRAPPAGRPTCRARARRPRRSRRPPPGPSSASPGRRRRACRAGRRAGTRPGHADRDVDDAPAPRPPERVGDDDRRRRPRVASRTAARIRPADASGSTGSSVTIEPARRPDVARRRPRRWRTRSRGRSR